MAVQESDSDKIKLKAREALNVFPKFKSHLKQYLYVSLHFALMEAVEHQSTEEKHRFFSFVCFGLVLCLFV